MSNLMRSKHFCKVKDKLQIGRKIFAKFTSDKGHVSKHIKKLLNPTISTKCHLKKGKRTKKRLSKEYIWITINLLKDSALAIIREIQITMREHYTYENV